MTAKREPPLHLASVLRPLKEILFFDVERNKNLPQDLRAELCRNVHIFSAKLNLEYAL